VYGKSPSIRCHSSDPKFIATYLDGEKVIIGPLMDTFMFTTLSSLEILRPSGHHSPLPEPGSLPPANRVCYLLLVRGSRYPIELVEVRESSLGHHGPIFLNCPLINPFCHLNGIRVSLVREILKEIAAATFESMASENFVQAAIPRFDGHYDHWSILMENFLRSKEYWQVVVDGIPEPAEGTTVPDA
ncbi:hypothetical protein KY289_009615, partial [Solanum tuberosum]